MSKCSCSKDRFIRCGTGPSKGWVIEVYLCLCGRIHPESPESITDEQRDWVLNYNKRLENDQRNQPA